ncbi:MAG: hypothetical protein WAV09_03015 [Minisyncoccia bacterium]
MMSHTRLKVLQGLIDGATVERISMKLNISRQAAGRHVRVCRAYNYVRGPYRMRGEVAIWQVTQLGKAMAELYTRLSAAHLGPLVISGAEVRAVLSLFSEA